MSGVAEEVFITGIVVMLTSTIVGLCLVGVLMLVTAVTILVIFAFVVLSVLMDVVFKA